MKLIDTHAHPHMEGNKLSASEYMAAAQAAGIEQIVCVGTNDRDSLRAIEFARRHKVLASVGLHPHEAKQYPRVLPRLRACLGAEVVVAIGECGLDYYYEHCSIADQQTAFRAQVDLALEFDLPLIFHVRNARASGQAFTDFFAIIDSYTAGGKQLQGVVHSFSADSSTMRACVERGFYIGLNGIMTFTKDEEQLAAAAALPLNNLVLETDAPFLTPVPYRGTINNSARVREVADFLSRLRGETLSELAEATTKNARKLYNL